MIKFFRHIRKSQLMENKTGKYVKYAIGEIVLVVIGILIALQVNNLNEQRKFNSLKNVYIERLIEDLKQDTLQANRLLDTLANKQIIIKTVVKNTDTKTSQELLIASLEDYFKSGWNMNEFTANMNTYTDLSQMGNMNVFRNTELTESIQQYYVLIENNEKGHILNKDWVTPIDVILAQKTSAFEFDPMTKELFQKSKQSEALTNILSNKELFTRNAAGHFWFNKSLIGAIKTIKINEDKLIKTLQLELEKR